jgi:hypothetical protein
MNSSSTRIEWAKSPDIVRDLLTRKFSERNAREHKSTMSTKDHVSSRMLTRLSIAWLCVLGALYCVILFLGRPENVMFRPDNIIFLMLAIPSVIGALMSWAFTRIDINPLR